MINRMFVETSWRVNLLLIFETSYRWEKMSHSDKNDSAGQSVSFRHCSDIKYMSGQEQGLTPVIPTLWEAEMGESPEVRGLRPAWPTWQNPISTKNTKISQANCGTCL